MTNPMTTPTDAAAGRIVEDAKELALLRQRNAEIWSNPQQWMRWCDHKMLERCERLEAQVASLTAERERLSAYVQHKPPCQGGGLSENIIVTCTCGLTPPRGAET